MIKLLIGGSPCTHWSIAQSKHRETKAEGIGWELFENYVIAKEKFKPDFFLYENNWSASKEIKDQIQEELGHELMRINSRLVSAQNRDRFYVFNWSVEQPEDRGILLKDVLETGESWVSRSYALTTRCSGATVDDTLKRHRHTMVAEPVRVGTYPTERGQLKGSQGQRIYSINGKSVTQSANGGGQGAKTGLYAVPYAIGYRSRSDENGKNVKRFEGGTEQKSNCITTVQTDSMVAEPIPVNTTIDGKAQCTRATCYKDGIRNMIGNDLDRRTCVAYEPKVIVPLKQAVYKVNNGTIAIKDKTYPIKLKDGYYIIRKLTPVECERLQTLPDGYTAAVSNTQRYKGLGNGWTAEVIIHILNGVLKDVPKDEKIVVLSMYDGIATGRYCLDKMGFTNVEYHVYEIDKYAMKVAMSNYPDIIQHGDAFQVRNSDWRM